ncbi:MAG TPA: hypothetical protein VK933_13415 [Longimicrobiales bacterium]|nr:hypothetical protein [Longimicrobiales bacterium]
MQRRTVLSLLLAVLLTAAGCASSGGTSARRDSRVLMPEEIATVPVNNLYEAIDRLRPRWLEMRDVRSLGTGVGQIVVFLNNSYVGGPETLRQFQAHQVVRIRYLDAAQASATLTGYDTSRHVVAGIVLETAEGR